MQLKLSPEGEKLAALSSLALSPSTHSCRLRVVNSSQSTAIATATAIADDDHHFRCAAAGSTGGTGPASRRTVLNEARKLTRRIFRNFQSASDLH